MTALDRAIGTIPHHADRLSHREAAKVIFAGVERKPLLARGFDHQDRLTRANVLAHLRGDDADDTVGGRMQDHLVKTALEHDHRRRGGLHLRVGDRALLPGRARHGRIVIRLRLRDIGTRACSVVFGLVERLLGLEALACQRIGSGEL